MRTPYSAERRRDLFDLEQRAVGDLDDPVAAVLGERLDERLDLALVGEAARHRAALRPLMRGRLRCRDADRAGLQRVGDEPTDLRELVVGRGTRERGIGAHDIEADHRVRHERRDVDALGQRAQRVEVLGEGLEAPVDTRLQRRHLHAFDELERLHDELAIFGTRRRDAEAAVALHDGGDAVPRRRRQVAVPEHLRIEVRVDVDEARRQHQTRQVDLVGAFARSDLADSGDPPVDHFDIGLPARPAGAVDNRGATQDRVHRSTP